MRLDLGCAVNCKDAALGELADIVIDPTTRRVTHLVVEPHHGLYTRRLVPIELVRAGDDGPLVLECSISEAAALEHAEETVYLRLGEAPVEDPKWDITATEMLALPYYEAMDMPGAVAPIDYDQGVNVHYERVPKGEVEVRRSSAVTSSDGHHLGHVDGFVVDGEQNVAALMLQHGHLWGKREVSIPIGAVERVDGDAVVLTLSKDDVGRLEPVRVHRWRSHSG
jgi:sporulation protein YlmC with PRC-barrel domain